MRVIYVIRQTDEDSTTIQATESTTERRTTPFTTTTTTAAETTTEATTTTTLEPTTTELSTEYPYCPPGVTAYYPMPHPDNCTQYYYCSRGTLRYTLACQGAGLFFTPGSDRCSSDVPPGCEHLVD